MDKSHTCWVLFNDNLLHKLPDINLLAIINRVREKIEVADKMSSVVKLSKEDEKSIWYLPPTEDDLMMDAALF